MPRTHVMTGRVTDICSPNAAVAGWQEEAGDTPKLMGKSAWHMQCRTAEGGTCLNK